MTTERSRMCGDADAWRFWGPYLSERQWGTVREDYSADGEAWEHFTYFDAPHRAYRWGEDGIAGISDRRQRLCLSLALWNGRDPILKERLFGLTNSQGNHGEDCKELYYYLDAIPSHSYLKMLYKYPHAEFPYARLTEENQRRDKTNAEFEILETGVFEDNRYFDVFVEYAKASPDDVLMRVTAFNRGNTSADLTLLPQLWFRNTWTWDGDSYVPEISAVDNRAFRIVHPKFSECTLWLDDPAETLFCDNRTNSARAFGAEGEDGFCKDGFHEYIVHGRSDAVNAAKRGTKSAALWRFSIAPGESATIRLRLCPSSTSDAFADFDHVFEQRLHDADEFYKELQEEIACPDSRRIQRQCLAGMIWTKQFYGFDVARWLQGDPTQPAPPPERKHGRNSDWLHLSNDDVISMPDKWEYPWYAAWDLAFHCLPLALVDAPFAKEQLLLFTRERYMHPNGQLPAYEWGFEDVNPPVHAWAAWRVFQIDKKQRGDAGDLPFLERVFHKMLLYFTWWVNRKDAEGHNIFQGGFLGLDNIGVFDRSAPLPSGGRINQADGTSWMAMFCLNMLRIALELSKQNAVYEDIAIKFFEHFLHIAKAMTNIADEGIGLWDEETEFYYDVLALPNGRHVPLKVRSMVGLIPLFAVETIEPETLERTPVFRKRLDWLLENRPDLARLVSRWHEVGRGERHLLSLLRGHRMKCLLRRALDPAEFLSPYGVRALSKHHQDHPYVLDCNGSPLTVTYQPAESDSRMFGGNSNWRGPIWFPVNYLIVESMQKFHHYYGDDFKIEHPTGSGEYVTLEEASNEIAHRLMGIFRRDEHGRRAVFGDSETMQNDPHFRDYVLFYEYFHGDTGRGVGASHQTGWTGLVAKLIQPRRREKAPSKPCPQYVAEFARTTH